MDDILSSEFLKRALDESDHGLVVTDLDGHIQSVSHRFLDLVGYTEKQVIGAKPRLFRSGQTPDVVYRDLWQTIRTGRTWKGAILNRRGDGALFLDRETIVGGIGPGGRACYVAIHRNADVELELRMKLAKAEVNSRSASPEVDQVKGAIKTLVTLSQSPLGDAAQALIAALEARDPYTAGHGRRTALMMELVGEELDLFSKYPLEAIRTGAILHDIGKVGVPDTILLKQGSLSEAEFDIVKSHPSIGFDILKLALDQEETLRIVLHHHERLDGSGYPDGLRSHEIPEYVRAFSVCDAFDAMTSSRSYRRAMAPEDAIASLTDDALTGRLHMAAVNAVRKLGKNGVLGDVRAMRDVA